MKNILSALICALAVAAPAHAQAVGTARPGRQAQPGWTAIPGIGQEKAEKPADVNGAWALQIDFGGGQTAAPSVTLKQEGEKLTGTYSSQVFGERPVTGTVKGNAVTFEFEGAMEGNKVKVTYSGTAEKDTMKGKVTIGDLGEGTFTAKKK